MTWTITCFIINHYNSPDTNKTNFLKGRVHFFQSRKNVNTKPNPHDKQHQA